MKFNARHLPEPVAQVNVGVSWDMTLITLDCSEFGFHTYNYWCSIEYRTTPCDLSEHTCTMTYYDWDWKLHTDDCINNLKDKVQWQYSISRSMIWHDTSVSEQLPYIWSYWVDWHEVNSGLTDWHLTHEWDFSTWDDPNKWLVDYLENPMCNLRNP